MQYLGRPYIDICSNKVNNSNMNRQVCCYYYWESSNKSNLTFCVNLPQSKTLNINKYVCSTYNKICLISGHFIAVVYCHNHIGTNYCPSFQDLKRICPALNCNIISSSITIHLNTLLDNYFPTYILTPSNAMTVPATTPTQVLPETRSISFNPMNVPWHSPANEQINSTTAN